MGVEPDLLAMSTDNMTYQTANTMGYFEWKLHSISFGMNALHSRLFPLSVNRDSLKEPTFLTLFPKVIGLSTTVLLCWQILSVP